MTPQPPLWRIILYAAGLTGLQIFAAIFIRHEGFSKGYKALYQWDSTHYENIALNGYVSSIKRTSNLGVMASGDVNKMTNVAFFPAYPILSRGMQAVTRLPIHIALLATAQIFAIVFWTYLLLLLWAFRIPRTLRWMAVSAMLFHPASFFLVAAYSESLFMTMLLGYIYWSNRHTSRAWIVAAAHGMVMTLARIHGIFASTYPLLLRACLPRGNRGDLRKALFISAASVLGFIGFFAFCQIAFGHWDLYMQRQWHGWGIRPNYAFLFNGHMNLLVTTNEKGWLDSDNFSGTLTTLTFWLFIIAGILEWISWRMTTDRGGWRTRLPLWITAVLLWYFYAASLANVDMRSMIRYLLAPHVLMILAFAHLFARLPRSLQMLRWIGITVAVTIMIGSGYVMTLSMQNFLWNIWVA